MRSAADALWLVLYSCGSRLFNDRQAGVGTERSDKDHNKDGATLHKGS